MPSHIIHPIPPVFDADSRILILGSFPSVKSRESCFFYGHPQNRFWKLLARLRKEDVPSSIEEKKEFLLRNHIAVWDTIHSCSIEGSSDSSIRDVVPNDLASDPGSRFHPGDLHKRRAVRKNVRPLLP